MPVISQDGDSRLLVSIMLKPFKTLSSRVVWSCPWYNVRQDEIVTPDGKPGVYNVVQHPDAVWIIPVTDMGEIVLIHTYRYTVDDWCYEIPAGSVKPDATPLTTAQAELREEIGGSARDWHYLGQFYTANGICNEVGHYFLATGVTLGATAHEPTEVIEVHPTPIPDALRMAAQGAISDAPSVMALLLCQQKLLEWYAATTAT